MPHAGPGQPGGDDRPQGTQPQHRHPLGPQALISLPAEKNALLGVAVGHGIRIAGLSAISCQLSAKKRSTHPGGEAESR